MRTRLSVASTVAFLYVVALMLGYELHLYEFYPIPNLVALAFFFCLLFTSGPKTPNALNSAGVSVAGLIVCLLGLQALRILLGSDESFTDFAKTLMACVFLGSCLFLSKNYIELVFKYIYLLSIIASGFNLLMFLSGGKLLAWEALYGTRYASLFYLHNIAAAVFGFQLIYALYNREMQRGLRILGGALAAFSVLISFSKGTVVAVVGAASLTSLAFTKSHWKFIPPLVAAAAVATFLTFREKIEDKFPQFRFFSGLNERDEMWAAAFDTVNEDKIALIGGGEPLLHSMISELGKDYLSTHNYYVDTLVSGGGITLVALFSFTLASLWGLRYRAHSRVFFAVALYLVISANKSRFSLGGITLLSVMLTLSFAYSLQSWQERRQRPALEVK